MRLTCTRSRIEKLEENLDDRIEFHKPLGFSDYVHLQKHAFDVSSDSGTISEESSIFSYPALNIREAHERPEAMEEASVIMTGLELNRVLQGLDVLIDQPRRDERLLWQVEDYKMENVSEKELRIIIIYTDYIRRNVWKSY